MSRELRCAGCGESENLRGEPSAEGIVIECGACGTRWLRDAAPPVCATCGGERVEERTRALTQYSRGTQLSITGLAPILLCRDCDSRMVSWCDEGRAVPMAYRSAAQEKDGGDSSLQPDDVDMTP